MVLILRKKLLKFWVLDEKTKNEIRPSHGISLNSQPKLTIPSGGYDWIIVLFKSPMVWEPNCLMEGFDFEFLNLGFMSTKHVSLQFLIKLTN